MRRKSLKSNGSATRPTATETEPSRSSTARLVLAIFAALAVLSIVLFRRKGTESAGPRAVVLESKVDANGNVIAAVRSEDGSLHFLTSGASVVGAQYTAAEFRDQAAFTGFALQEAVVFSNRSIRRALQLGLGAGIVPSFLRGHNVRVDVVEYSGQILHMAENYFSFNSCCNSSAAVCVENSDDAHVCERRYGRTAVREAREWLFNQSDGIPRFDVIISDLFSGSNPGHLHSKEVFDRIKHAWLIPGGILVVNFVGLHHGEGSTNACSLAQTLREVFGVVRCYRDQSPELESDHAANLACFASAAPFVFNVPRHGNFADAVEYSDLWVMKHFQAWEVLQSADCDGAGIFTDAHNALLDAGAQGRVEEQLWRHAQELIPKYVWQELGVMQ